MNCDADRNTVEQRPLRTTHAADFWQKAEMDVEHAEAWNCEKRLAQNISASENYQVWRPCFQACERSRGVLIATQGDRKVVGLCYVVQGAKILASAFEQRLKVGI